LFIHEECQYFRDINPTCFRSTCEQKFVFNAFYDNEHNILNVRLNVS